MAAPAASRRHDLVASEGRALWQARRHALDIEAQGGSVLLVAYTPGAATVTIGRPGSGTPSSLSFALDPAGCAALTDYLARTSAKTIELFDVARTPDALLDALFAFSASVEIVGVDLWALRGAPTPRLGRARMPGCRSCVACLDDYDASNDAPQRREREARLVRALTAARTVRSLDRLGGAFARRVFGQKAAVLESEAGPAGLNDTLARETGRLGICAYPSWECDRIAVRLARTLASPERIAAS